MRCFHCGHDLPPPAGAAQRSCPRCRVPLQVVAATWVSVDACQSCGGVFHDRGELERALRTGAAKLDWLRRQLTPAQPDERRFEHSAPAVDAVFDVIGSLFDLEV